MVSVSPDVDREGEPEIERVDRFVSLVRFPPLDVRPHTKHRVQRVLIAPPPALSGQTLPVIWRLTARNTSGQLRGEIDLVMPGEAVAVAPANEPDSAEPDES
jgi:hypothetical protein